MRLVFALLLSLTSYQVFAQKLEPEINFILRTPLLLDGEVQYSFSVLSAEALRKKYPLLSELDTLELLNSKDASFMISKFAFVVKKPLGVFDQKETDEAEFLSYLAQGKVQKIKDGVYQYHLEGQPGLKYKLTRYEDSDDISTLSRSRAARGIQAAKRLDPLFQSASLMTFHELTDFGHSFNGATELYAYLPLNESRTLVFGFKFISLKDYANDSGLRQGLQEEIFNFKRLIDERKSP